MKKHPVLLATAGLTLLSSLPLHAASSSSSLNFDPLHFTPQTITYNNQSVKIRAYEGLSYASNPVSPKEQVMNIYIPEAYFNGKGLGLFNAETAPIFFPNKVGGYMPSKPASTIQSNGSGGNEALLAALSRGFIVASPGTRGRTSTNESGTYVGKAPAVIVDLKAAVRYLRFNDAAMPGDAEKIISNGTSAGGAVSALLAASGNSPDYQAELAKIGAAETRDDIFAASAFCPITNLEHADMAYEWQFNSVHDYKTMNIRMLDYHVERSFTEGTLTTAEVKVSNQLKSAFPAYVNQLSLHNAEGEPLTLNPDGSGSFKAHIESLVIASAQNALNQGQSLDEFGWLTVQQGKVTGINFDAYLNYMTRLKRPPAFDALDLSSGENQLFGTSAIDKRHFTSFSATNSQVEGSSLADTATIAMMNAMNYVSDPTATQAQFWRIRHGTNDKDTSLAVPALLALALEQQGITPDFELSWNRPHSGDYNLASLFTWIDQISTQN